MRPILQFALVTLLLAGNDGCAHRSPQPGDSRGLYDNSIVIKGSDTMVLLAQWWAENYLKSHSLYPLSRSISIRSSSGCGTVSSVLAVVMKKTFDRSRRARYF